MKSKNRILNQNNYEFERCTKKQCKMHKLCIKSSERESKSFNSKNSKRTKSMQKFHEFEFKRKSDRKFRSRDAECRQDAKYAKFAERERHEQMRKKII